MGLALLLNSKVTRISIKTFGLYGHTSFCHVFQVIRALLLGFVPTPSMQWVNGFMGWVTVRVLTPDTNFPCVSRLLIRAHGVWTRARRRTRCTSS